MKMTRRILSWVLAIAMVVTCGITGLVLPASASEAVDLLNGQGTFEEGTAASSTILSDMMTTSKGKGVVVDNPNGEGKVLQIGKFVDADEDGVNDGNYTHTSYPKLKKLYDTEKGTYDKPMEVGKAYTISLDVYGEPIAVYFVNYTVLSHNAESNKSEKSGWFQLGDAAAKEWKTYTFTFYPHDNIASKHQTGDWWSWFISFSKSTSANAGANHCSVNGYTYIDNFTLVETQATAIALDAESVVLEPGDKTEAPVVTATPVRSAYADVVYTTDNAEVATVDAATGVITATGHGTATITATAGELTDTIKVTVQADKTRVNLNTAAFTYAKTNDGMGWKAGDVVPTSYDAKAGLNYVTVKNAVEASVSDLAYSVVTPKLPKIEKDEYIGISFLARIAEDVGENTGKVVFALQLDGGLAVGYMQPEFYANATQGWVRYTLYVKSYSTTENAIVRFFTYGKKADANDVRKNVTYTGDLSLDIAEFYVFKPDGANERNFVGEGGDFEEGYIPRVFGSYQAEGIISTAKVVDDPTGAKNKVLSVPAKGAYIDPTYLYHKLTTAGTTSVGWTKGAMYKITFKAYGSGTVSFASWSNPKVTFPLVENAKGKAGEWRTVTAYALMNGAAYSSIQITYPSGCYVDDFAIYKVENATGFEINAETEMQLNESQTISYNTIPKHAYPGAATLAVSGTGYSLSGTTLSVKPVSGQTVSTGTITVTSDLVDAEGNPLTSSLTVNANYPKEHFVNGSMDNGTDGINFGSGATNAEIGVDGVGVDGSKGLALNGKGYVYFKKQTFVVRPNSLYCFSAAVRSDGTGGKLQIPFSDAGNANNNNSGNTLCYQHGASNPKTVTSEWQTFKVYVMTGPTTTSLSSDWTAGFDVTAVSKKDDKEVPIYVDNISFEQIATKDFILLYKKHSSSTMYISKDGKNYVTDVLTDVTPGTVVSVKTWHHSSLITVPGTYTFTANDGSVTKILNQDAVNGYTEANFGKKTGEYCQFVMPNVNNGFVDLPSTKVANLKGDFAMDTVATSLRYTDEEGVYDGIRFLTRVAFDKKFDPSAESLTVTYQGTEYTVIEFGSLLDRYEEGVDLTYEDAKWKSAAYIKGHETLDTMKLLDYTTQKADTYTNYIDFASVMTKGENVSQEAFDARQYTARGYMILDADADGRYTEGVDIVVYSTNQMTDSVNSAKARL